jgi:hypothetical protein
LKGRMGGILNLQRVAKEVLREKSLTGEAKSYIIFE